MKYIRLIASFLVTVVSMYYAYGYAHRWSAVYYFQHTTAWGISYDPDITIYGHIQAMTVATSLISLLALIWLLTEVRRIAHSDKPVAS